MKDSYTKIQKVQNEVEQVKEVMTDNIEKILKRGEKVEVLLNKSEQLSNESTIFRNSSKNLKRKICIKNAKIILGILLFIALLVIIIIITSN